MDDETIKQYYSDLEAWLDEGQRKGFCSTVYCSTHDGFAPEDTDVVELQLQEIGFDYCWFVVTVGSQNTATRIPHLLKNAEREK